MRGQQEPLWGWKEQQSDEKDQLCLWSLVRSNLYASKTNIPHTFPGKCWIPYWFTRFPISLTSEGLPAVGITRLWPASNRVIPSYSPFQKPHHPSRCCSSAPWTEFQPCSNTSPLPAKSWEGGEREIKIWWWKCLVECGWAGEREAWTLLPPN